MIWRKFCARLAIPALALAVSLSGAALAQTADSPYKGKTVRFLTTADVHDNALANEMRNVAKQMGINLDVRQLTTDELQKKVVLDFVGGADTWDIISTGGQQRMFEWYDGGIIQDIAPYIQKIGDPKLLDWGGLTDEARNAAKLGDKVLGLVTTQSDPTLAYRTDLFNNEEERASFKAKYGYDLAPPETYKQFRDTAEFFTRKKGQKLAGKVLDQDFYGASAGNKNGTFLWHAYENVLLAFGVEIYNPQTKKVGLTSQASIDAAKFYQSMMPFWPPNNVNMSSSESTHGFADGQSAMLVDYIDRIVSAVGTPNSAVKTDQVAYAFLPTAEGNPLGRKHAFRAGPGVVGIFGRSRNPEAAFALLEATNTADEQLKIAHEVLGYIPSRTATLQQIAKEQPSLQYMVNVATAHVDADTDATVMPYPSILQSTEISDAISNAISAILTGAKVEDQLAKAQSSVEKIVSKLK